MQILEPTIQIKRLIVVKDKSVMYEGEFHPGVNVITGPNSSGKTTILDLIAYTLGMEEIKLKPEALSCNFSYLELMVNNQILTIRREISQVPRRPISITFSELNSNNLDSYVWTTYQIGRSEKLSFSQIMFNFMDSSEYNTDASASLTMHQILRCLYASQAYIHFPILTASIQDDSLTRKTIGEYLLGFYDNQLYIKQIDLKEKTKLKARLTTELNFLKGIFQKSYFTFNKKSDALRQLDKLQKEKNSISEELNSKKRRPKKIEKCNINLLEQLNSQIISLSKVKNDLELESNKLYLNSLDSQIFINELQDRIKRLEESNYLQNFSEVTFEFCPSCLSKIDNLSANSCALCKCDSSEKNLHSSPLLRMKNELLLQLEESNKIETSRIEKLELLKIKSDNLDDQIRSLSSQKQTLSEHWTDNEKAYISNLSFQLGKIDNEISEINKILPVYDDHANITAQLTQINDEIIILSSEISVLEEINIQESQKTIEALNKNLAELLQTDLPREEEFIAPNNINISFADNQISINNKSTFSESSTVILRHLFHLALLKTSDSIKKMRFPKLLILDGIDDGGLEPERILNLQSIIMETSDSLKHSHQIILGTSTTYLNESLKKYAYNAVFTIENKSLRVLKETNHTS